MAWGMETSGMELGIRRHAWAAALACLLSLVVHVGLLLWGPEWQLLAPLRAARQVARALHALKVAEVRSDPVAERAVEGVVSPPSGAEALDTARHVEAVRQPPDRTAMEPRSPEHKLIGELTPVAPPTAVTAPNFWQPRQEILAIERRLVSDDVAMLPRRAIPRVERVNEAEDFVAAYDARRAERIGSAGRTGPETPGRGKWIGNQVTGGSARAQELAIGESKAERAGEALVEKAKDITALQPIERLLAVDVRTYTPFRDRYGYARIDIRRAGPEVTPVMPKDVLLVQDSSASMTEKKLHFCREGLMRCLAAIGPEDRFNVVGFRDTTDRCFEGWATNSLETLNRAAEFVTGMRAEGNTDIYASIQELLRMPRNPTRPVVALLVTDGRPTVGLTDSTDIIGEFSRLNDGRISVFTMGTVQTANSYLLDLLSYCNRGDAAIVRSGMWGIADALQKRMVEISRPVLADVGFLFPSRGECEVFPVQTSNLYLDRPLVLYGRYPRTVRNLVFQAVGTGRRAQCDMIFNVSLDTGVLEGDEEIRDNWAKQRIYHTMGEYARRPSVHLLRDMHETARRYNVPVPYKDRL
jgi:Mg-chelatase subunit ChlD